MLEEYTTQFVSPTGIYLLGYSQQMPVSPLPKRRVYKDSLLAR